MRDPLDSNSRKIELSSTEIFLANGQDIIYNLFLGWSNIYRNRYNKEP